MRNSILVLHHYAFSFFAASLRTKDLRWIRFSMKRSAISLHAWLISFTNYCRKDFDLNGKRCIFAKRNRHKSQCPVLYIRLQQYRLLDIYTWAILCIFLYWGLCAVFLHLMFLDFRSSLAFCRNSSPQGCGKCMCIPMNVWERNDYKLCIEMF